MTCRPRCTYGKTLRGLDKRRPRGPLTPGRQNTRDCGTMRLMKSSQPTLMPVDADTHPSSPCIGVCQMQADGMCIGCRRTLDEICAWPSANAAQKTAIWQRLLTLPPQAVAKICQRCQEPFTCGSGGQDGCWCMDLPRQASLDPALGDCLCASCLKAALQA